MSVFWYTHPPTRQSLSEQDRSYLISAMPVSHQQHDAFTKVIATVVDRQATVINSPLDSSVVKMYVRDGDVVRKGDVLIELDAEDMARNFEVLLTKRQQHAQSINTYEQQLAQQNQLVQQQEALHLLSMKKRDRHKILLDEKLISEQRGDDLQIEILQQETQMLKERSMLLSLQQQRNAELTAFKDTSRQIANLEESIESAKIRAPWDGVVQMRLVRVGAEVRKTEPLLSLQGKQFDLVAPLTISKYRKLSQLGTISGFVDYQGERLLLEQGKLTHYQPNVQPEVIWSLPGPEWIAGEHMTAFVRVPQQQMTMRIPQKAVFGQKVYIVDDGELRGVPIEIVDRSDEGVPSFLVSGLADGMIVMTTAIAGPKEGLAVRVKP